VDPFIKLQYSPYLKKSQSGHLACHPIAERYAYIACRRGVFGAIQDDDTLSHGSMQYNHDPLPVASWKIG
jgi:hypothetical protein